MAITLPWLESPLSCGDLHGAPVVGVPALKVHRRYFFGNDGEVEIFGGKGGRQITLNAILNNTTWANTWNAYNYIKTSLDGGIGVNGVVEVTFPDSAKAVFEKCTFDRYELVPQPGHQMAAPLLDGTGSLNGVADTWWVELNLYFYQLQASLSDSAYTAV
jgi:hypothetical protein